jgi:cell wall-associated NlpC family hydrolase
MLKKAMFLAFIFLSAFAFFGLTKEIISASSVSRNINSLVDRTALITYAKQFLGITYCKCSYNPKTGFDCSGFVYYVFKKFNIKVPRSSVEYQFLGTALKPVEFKVGDVLVFYGFKDSSHIGHVGIICEANGMKSRFIHSSSGKINGVTISSLDSKMYHKRFYKCIDVIKQH